MAKFSIEFVQRLNPKLINLGPAHCSYLAPSAPPLILFRPPGHDFAPIRAPETPKRHLGHGFAHFRAGGRGKAIFLAEARADYDEKRLTL